MDANPDETSQPADDGAGPGSPGAEFEVLGSALRCPNCGAEFDLADVSIQSVQPAVDTTRTASDDDPIVVSCPACHTRGQAVIRKMEQ